MSELAWSERKVRIGDGAAASLMFTAVVVEKRYEGLFSNGDPYNIQYWAPEWAAYIISVLIRNNSIRPVDLGYDERDDDKRQKLIAIMHTAQHDLAYRQRLESYVRLGVCSIDEMLHLRKENP